MARARQRFFDPDGTRYGLPSFPWRCAPEGLATRRQLRAAGLQPARQPIAAQVLWVGGRRVRTAYLYEVARAKPKRAPSAAQLRAVAVATAARRVCPTCRRDVGYVIPARFGECLDCAEPITAPVFGAGVAG